jgi:flagellar biosynthesis/type III secretory pathway protein FliH
LQSGLPPRGDCVAAQDENGSARTAQGVAHQSAVAGPIVGLDAARRRFLSGFINTYLQLTEKEQEQFQAELAQLPPQEQEVTMELTTTWKEEGRQEGILEGWEKGKQEGLLEEQAGRLSGRGVQPDATVLDAACRANHARTGGTHAQALPSAVGAAF